jgi:hypothetical protein
MTKDRKEAHTPTHYLSNPADESEGQEGGVVADEDSTRSQKCSCGQVCSCASL